MCSTFKWDNNLTSTNEKYAKNTIVFHFEFILNLVIINSRLRQNHDYKWTFFSGEQQHNNGVKLNFTIINNTFNQSIIICDSIVAAAWYFLPYNFKIILSITAVPETVALITYKKTKRAENANQTKEYCIAQSQSVQTVLNRASMVRPTFDQLLHNCCTTLA